MGRYLDKVHRWEREHESEEAKEAKELLSLSKKSEISEISSYERRRGDSVNKSRDGEISELSEIRSDGSDVVIEPAVRPDGAPLSMIYWESTDGRIHGPCAITHVAHAEGRFWVLVEEQGTLVWVHESRLRSKQQANRL